MRITMNRDTCQTILPACEECFGTFILHGGYPDRACITGVVDDGCPELTLLIQYEGREETVVVTDENREMLAYEGWDRFVSVPPHFAHTLETQEPPPHEDR